jgi:hypothetical protein
MSNKAGKMALMLGLASAMSGGFAPTGQHFVPIDPEEAEKRRERKVRQNKPKIAQANGLKEFVYQDGTVVYAINQKNADKKYRKLKSV